MTDLEKFIDLYKSFGIECLVNKEGDIQNIYLVEKYYTEQEKIKATKHEKLTGYGGFLSIVSFDLAGKFIDQGFYE